MTNFFMTTSADEVRITDGTETYQVGFNPYGDVKMVNGTYRTSDTTIGTVPTGKKWYVVGAMLNANITSTSNIIEARMKAGGDIILAAGVNYGVGTTNSIRFDLRACPVLEAGDTVVLDSTGSMYMTGTLFYIERDE